MTEYEVLAILAGVVVFAITVGTPVIKLNTNVTKLLSAVDMLQKTVDALTSDNKAAHERIWEKTDQHTEQIADHDKRISVLEHKGEK